MASKRTSSKKNQLKYLYPVRKSKYDENRSFMYFRSFITFYNWVILEKFSKNQIKSEFKKFYRSDNYFDVYWDLFHLKEDMALMTYYNQIPSIFAIFPEEYYYYYPVITFYNNHERKYYQNTPLKITSPSNKRLIPNDMIKFAKDEVRVTIPIEKLSEYQLPKDSVLFILSHQNCYLTKSKEVQIKDNHLILGDYDYKADKSYEYKSKKDTTIPFSEIKFLSVLKKITPQHLLDTFEMDTMPKGSILYHNIPKPESEAHKPQMFFSIYPKLNLKKFMFESYEKDKDWHCYTVQLTKDIKTLNLTIDTFYNNPFVLKKVKTDQYSYYDPSDPKYKTIKKNKIFRCLNNSKVISQRKEICNLNLIQVENGLNKKLNSGKRILYMIINKNMSYIVVPWKALYYVNFLKELGIKSFIYNLGYVLKGGDQYHYGCEFGFVENDISAQYTKDLDFKKRRM